MATVNPSQKSERWNTFCRASLVPEMTTVSKPKSRPPARRPWPRPAPPCARRGAGTQRSPGSEPVLADAGGTFDLLVGEDVVLVAAPRGELGDHRLSLAKTRSSLFCTHLRHSASGVMPAGLAIFRPGRPETVRLCVACRPPACFSRLDVDMGQLLGTHDAAQNSLDQLTLLRITAFAGFNGLGAGKAPIKGKLLSSPISQQSRCDCRSRKTHDGLSPVARLAPPPFRGTCASAIWPPPCTIRLRLPFRGESSAEGGAW